MKTLILFLLFTVLAFGQVQDKIQLIPVINDTIGNSQTKIGYVDIADIESWDSLRVYVVVNTDSVNIDSTVKYALGFQGQVPNPSFGSLLISQFGSDTNLNMGADIGAAHSSTTKQGITNTLSRATAYGYKTLKITVTANSTRNNKTVSGQRVVAYLVVYR
jgi:hypothetical protein